MNCSGANSFTSPSGSLACNANSASSIARKASYRTQAALFSRSLRQSRMISPNVTAFSARADLALLKTSRAKRSVHRFVDSRIDIEYCHQVRKLQQLLHARVGTRKLHRMSQTLRPHVQHYDLTEARTVHHFDFRKINHQP